MKHRSLEALCDRRQLLGQWTQVVQLSHPTLEDVTFRSGPRHYRFVSFQNDAAFLLTLIWTCVGL